MPVFQAVIEHATVERVVVAPILLLEVTIAVVVGLLVGRDVTDDHVELCGKERESAVSPQCSISMKAIMLQLLLIVEGSGKMISNVQAGIHMTLCIKFYVHVRM